MKEADRFEIYIVYSFMLLRVENTSAEKINQLLAYARENHIVLSAADETVMETTMPGKQLSASQLTQLIEKSRQSGVVSMNDAHRVLKSLY